MKAKLLVVSLSLMIAAACSKDKFETKPHLSFESINGESYVAGQTVTIKLRLNDKEGDFEADDSAGYMRQALYFKKVSSVCPDDTATLTYDIPAFSTSKFLDVRLDLNFTYNIRGQYAPIDRCQPGSDDSLYFRFWIKDAADNVSDTVNTPAFKLIKD